MNFFPKTRVGTWGFSLSIVFALLFVLKVSLPIPVPSFAIFGIGILGVILNVIALFRGERSIVFYVFGGLISFFVLFWVGGELLFPH